MLCWPTPDRWGFFLPNKILCYPFPGKFVEVLDEPAANQSDATVLELQLRAISKKQHGDVAVRYVRVPGFMLKEGNIATRTLSSCRFLSC